MREFNSGAIRDTDNTKLSYVKGLSPIVLRRYLEYLDVHRTQADGNKRTFDNWKNGIPEEVYIDSLCRHTIDAWLLFDGFSTEDNHGPVIIEDALCGILFNTMGFLHELLKKEIK
jgi:hypothetical protein